MIDYEQIMIYDLTYHHMWWQYYYMNILCNDIILIWVCWGST